VNRIVLFASLILLFQLHAQHEFRGGLVTDFGIPINSFDQNRSVLKGKGFNFQSNWGLALQYKAFNRIGLEIGITQNYARWKIKDKNFESRHDGYKAVTTNNNYYWGYYTALHYYQPLSDQTSLYLGGGIAWNRIGTYSESIVKNFYIEKESGFINEDVSSEVTYNSDNLAYFGEIGIQQALSDQASISFGLKTNFGQGQMSQGSYSVFNVIDQTYLSQDKFSSVGTFVGLNVKYTYTLWKKEKRVPVPKVKPQPVVKEKETPTPTPTPQPKPKPQPSKVEGRTVKVSQKVTVRNPTVRVQVWDDQEIDGDRISLKLDEMWIMQNYTLTEKKKEVLITLKPGLNYFTLHALNLGRLSPNTAALNIIDGAQTHKIVLESTLTQSGTIEINYVP
jgi:opacity protein-like surface antigen